MVYCQLQRVSVVWQAAAIRCGRKTGTMWGVVYGEIFFGERSLDLGFIKLVKTVCVSLGHVWLGSAIDLTIGL
jgi:hypothetical protein